VLAREAAIMEVQRLEKQLSDTSRAAQDAVRRIKEMEADADDLARKSLSEKVRMQNEFDRNRSELAQVHRQRDEEHHALMAARAEIDKLKALLNEAETNLAKAERQSAQDAALLRELQASAEAARKGDLDRFNRERGELLNQLDEARKAADAAERALQQAAGPRAALERRLSDAEAQAAAAEAELKSLTRQLKDAPSQGDLERVLGDMEMLRDENRTLKAELARPAPLPAPDRTPELNALQARWADEKAVLEARLAVEAAARRAAQEQAAAAAQSHEQEVQYYQEVAERAEAAIGQERARSEMTQHSLEMKIRRLDEALASDGSRQQEIEAVIANLESQLARERELSAQNANQARDKVDQLGRQLGALRDKEESLRAAHQVIHKQTREIENLERQLDKAKSGPPVPDRSGEIDSLQRQLKSVQEALLNVEAERRQSEISYQAEVSDLRTSADKLSSEVSYYKTLAEQNSKELDHARTARDSTVLDWARERESFVLRSSRC